MQGTSKISMAQVHQRNLGYTLEHDVEHHADGELVEMAVAFALGAGTTTYTSLASEWDVYSHLPQDLDTDRGTQWRIEQLAKAGACIASEIERLHEIARNSVLVVSE